MFKKITIVLALITLLAACNTNEEADKNEDIIENVKDSAQSEPTEEQVDENTVDDEISSLPEYQTIVNEVEDKDFAFKKVTDNEGTRIFLLADEDGTEQYKTIFIKETNRLKIIELTGDGEIFNDVVKK